MSELRVTFLGTGGSTPLAGRGFPATLVQREGERLLFDCGEGTQRQMAQNGGLVDVDVVFLTHYHADHTYGLPPLLGTYSMRGRTKALKVFGPSEGLDRFRQFVRSCIKDQRLTFPVEYVGVGVNPKLANGTIVYPPLGQPAYDVVAVQAAHNVRNAVSYGVVEVAREGKLDVAKARGLGVTEGRDFGSLKAGVSVRAPDGTLVTPNQVVGPHRPGRKVVISGDTRPNDMLARLAKGADLLVHEATFPHADRLDAYKKGHSTARQAAEVATRAEVTCFAPYHVGPKVTPRILRDECSSSSYELLLPSDGHVREIELR